MRQIFESSQRLEKQGWTFTMQASMLEIYNEELRDLLGKRPKASQASQTAESKKHQAGPPMKHQAGPPMKHQAGPPMKHSGGCSGCSVVELGAWSEEQYESSHGA
jgi:hypothetical protein